MNSRTLVPLAALVVVVLVTGSGFAVAAGPRVPGNAARGKALFLRTGLFCGSCHTLKAAKSRGRDGPNLDKTKPSYAKIVERITKGRNATRRWPTGMPGYSGNHAFVNEAQIRDIAAFVYTATHR
jgi:mono/diheme cytochrome c family protein